jgi:two-component system cell cycle sensor histidine kinase/response regulator CckA
MLRRFFSKSGKAQQARKPEQAPTPVPERPVLRILMLEDESALSAILREYLEFNSCKVTCVKSGVEGLKRVMAHDFDAIVCDMLLPSLPGDMFYIAVQKVKPDLCKRFVFMTGHKGDKKIDDFIRSVGGLMLWKPFEPHELLRAIDSVIIS